MSSDVMIAAALSGFLRRTDIHHHIGHILVTPDSSQSNLYNQNSLENIIIYSITIKLSMTTTKEIRTKGKCSMFLAAVTFFQLLIAKVQIHNINLFFRIFRAS